MSAPSSSATDGDDATAAEREDCKPPVAVDLELLYKLHQVGRGGVCVCVCFCVCFYECAPILVCVVCLSGACAPVLNKKKIPDVCFVWTSTPNKHGSLCLCVCVCLHCVGG